jgi:pimeloyl-ACP methyl ester carboxylesterase
VLRFDYQGSGDSAGDGEETTVDQCLTDIGVSIEELKDIAGVTKVSLVGLRFGATVAALTAAARNDIDQVVLWDPVLDGGAYLKELADVQRLWLEDRLGPRGTLAARDSELIGFPLTDDGRRQMGSIAILPPPKLRARSIRLMVSHDDPSYHAFRLALESASAPVDYQVVPGAGEWDRGDLVHQILLPHAMVRAIAAAVVS